MSEKRNIVLITLDSVRADHCSFMGYHRETTPNIDRMAREGLYFENAIAASIPTPHSLFSVFTGEYPFVDFYSRDFQGWRNEFRYRATLSQTLSKRGYFTVAVNPNPFASKVLGFGKGFKHFHDFGYKNTGLLYKLFKWVGFSEVVPDLILGKGTTTKCEELFQCIKKIRINEPFFLWVLLLDTHTPYFPPRKFRKYSNFFEILKCNWAVSKEARTGKNFSPKWREGIINAYDDCITYADNFIKELWKFLEPFDPIFVIHADHGDGFYEHGFYYHYDPFLYEELIHVPLVIYNADVKGRIDKPVSLLGLAPTILELIGEENEFPSESFLHEGKDWIISKVFEGGKRKVAVRTKDWKFITGQKEEDELYYLKEDPYEQKNVINEHPDLAKEMRKIVKDHVKYEIEIRKIRRRVISLRKL